MTRYENLGTDLLWMKRLIFAGIFIQENKLHAAYDRYGVISCKQWLLLVMLQGYDSAPDLSEIGKSMGCSRQNIKKLALSLEKNGFIDLRKSPNDSRSLCVHKTDKYYDFIKENNSTGIGAHEALFKEFSDEEIKTYYELTKKLYHGIDNVDLYFKSIKEKSNENEKNN